MKYVKRKFKLFNRIIYSNSYKNYNKFKVKFRLIANSKKTLAFEMTIFKVIIVVVVYKFK